MDPRTFDRLARLLGGATDRRAGLKALAGGLLGAGGLAALDADADTEAKRRGRDTGRNRAADEAEAKRRKKRKKTCKPACEAGFECVKAGKKRACVCASGVTCGAACCAAGQVCEGGACADAPEPTTCIDAGQPCKNVGRRCCDGRVCASGQGGDADVACYVPKSGACATTADCVYGMGCRGRRCAPPEPGQLGSPCDAAGQQVCTTPGATCTAYTGAGAPDGAHCTLPLRRVCTGDIDCTCYTCWYLQDGVASEGVRGAGRRGRQGRISDNVKGCCHTERMECASEADCCLGLNCTGGVCGGGAVCVPDDAEGCDAAPCCSDTASCIGNVCKLGIPPGADCSTGSGSLPCLEGATCQVHPGGADTYCLKADGDSCAAGAGSIAADDTCASGHCVSGFCRECAGSGDCASGQYCASGFCTAKMANGQACAAGDQCRSGNCSSGGSCVACSDDGDCPSTTPACSDGACIECATDAHCPTDACKTVTCNVGTNTCSAVDKQDGASCGTSGTCASGTCCEITGSGLAEGAPCCGNGQCASGLCWYPQDDDGYAVGTQKQCVVATGGDCDYDTSEYAPCGLGNFCGDDNTCTDTYDDPGDYPLSVPTGGTGCDATHPCYSSSDYCNVVGACVARTEVALMEPCDPATNECPSGASCTTYGTGSGAPDTTATYCLRGFNSTPNSPAAVDECASYRIYNGRCTKVCDIYLTAGDDDAERGAALKAALEAKVSGSGGLVNVEPDPAGVKKYVTGEISLALNFANDTGFVGLDNCYGFNATARPVISGNDANRILNITHASGGKGKFYAQYVNFEAGNATGDGGAIRISTPATLSYSSSSDLYNHVLYGITVSGSSATGDGGCVWVEGPISVASSVLSNCSAGGKGGGLYSKTVNGQYAVVTTTTSTLGNTATGGGAGVYWAGTAADQFRCSPSPVRPTLGICAWSTTPTTSVNCQCSSTTIIS